MKEAAFWRPVAKVIVDLAPTIGPEKLVESISNAMAIAHATPFGDEARFCKWNQIQGGIWHTECKNSFTVRIDSFLFCPGCGGIMEANTDSAVAL